MLKDLKFAVYSTGKNFANAAENRASFLSLFLSMALTDVVFVILWSAFAHTVGPIRGWTPVDIILLQGISAIAWGTAMGFAAGITSLPETIASGGFDRFILSPKNILLRTATSRLSPASLGDIVFGFVCIAAYAWLRALPVGEVLFIILCIIPALIAATGAIIFAASTAFRLKNPQSGPQSIFELILTPSIFHGGAFPDWMRFIFTFALPSLLIGTLPVETFKSFSFAQWSFIFIVSALWLTFAIRFFYRGIRRYESASTGGFGS